MCSITIDKRGGTKSSERKKQEKAMSLENVQVQQTVARSAMPCRNCRIDYRERFFWQRFHLVVGSVESGDNEIFCLFSHLCEDPLPLHL